VPVLLAHYLKFFSEENKMPLLTIEPGALRHLQRYPWPGNIRELRNFTENAVVLRRGGKLTEYDLEPRFRGEVLALPPGSSMAAGAIGAQAGAGNAMSGVASGAGGGPVGSPVFSSPASASLLIQDNEKRLLREALIKARGNRTKAAELMGISRRTLHRKLADWPELDVIDK
jgi:two-component system, NtrC family, response regulator AtoC